MAETSCAQKLEGGNDIGANDLWASQGVDSACDNHDNWDNLLPSLVLPYFVWSMHKTSRLLLLSNLPLSLSLQIAWSVFKQLLWDFTDCSDSRWELWLTARLHPVHLPLPLTPPRPLRRTPCDCSLRRAGLWRHPHLWKRLVRRVSCPSPVKSEF